jgi:hypothetical protein
MKMSSRYLICCLIVFVAAAPMPAEDSMYWEGDFGPIALHITSRLIPAEASAMITLYTTGDVHISANNSGTAARLTRGSDFLITEYRLVFDSSGGTTGSEVPYTAYNLFLATPSEVIHAPGDDEVKVTLWVRASNRPGNVEDAGEYSATLILTTSWAGGL